MEVAQYLVKWWVILAVDMLKVMIQLPESNCGCYCASVFRKRAVFVVMNTRRHEKVLVKIPTFITTCDQEHVPV
jgi:hypothetical protein